MKNKKNLVFTIGHSSHSLETFVMLLQKHGITALVDVRSSPFSHFTPQFNRINLEQETRKHHIEYMFLGRQLGGRPKDSSCYENGEVQFDRLTRTELFQKGINLVIREAQRHIIALMCSEKDPLQCHRFLPISDVLVKHNINVAHILADGNLKSHEEMVKEMVKKLPDPAGSAQDDLFDSKEKLVFLLQEKRIAYVDKEKLPNKK